MKRECGFVACIIAAILPAAFAHAATERLLRASDAHVEWIGERAATADGHGPVLRLHTPDGQVLDLVLEQQLALTADARPHVAAVRNGDTQVLAGEVAARPGSWARLTRIEGAWLGAVHDGAQLWFLEPARHHMALARGLGVPDSGTLVHTMADLAEPLDLHGDTVPGGMALDAVLADASQRGLLAATGRELRVTLVLDTYFQALYPSAPSVALATLNVADGFYAAQMGTRLRLHHMVVLGDDGPLTATVPGDLLEDFGAFVRDNAIPHHGVAHLLTAKDLHGPTVGLAYINGACSGELGYGLNQMTYAAAGNATLLAHEIGHNLGIQHDNHVFLPLGITTAMTAECNTFHIMRPSIHPGNPGTDFSECSLIWFDHFLATYPNACLVPIGLPFRSGFELSPQVIP